MSPTCVLVDARTWAACKPVLLDRLRSATFIGFDIETEDSRAHAGIQAYRKADTAKVFDVNRTTVTGFSLHIEGDAEAFYVNLANAGNRLPWAEARQFLDAKPAGAHWIAHNAAYELTMMATSLGYALDDIICTLQMAVSAYAARTNTPTTPSPRPGSARWPG